MEWKKSEICEANLFVRDDKNSGMHDCALLPCITVTKLSVLRKKNYNSNSTPDSLRTQFKSKYLTYFPGCIYFK